MGLKESLHEKIKSLPVPATPGKSRPAAIKEIFSSARVLYLNPDSLETNTPQSLKSGIPASSLCCLPVLSLFPCKLASRGGEVERPSDTEPLCQTENPARSSAAKHPSTPPAPGQPRAGGEPRGTALPHTGIPLGMLPPTQNCLSLHVPDLAGTLGISEVGGESKN